jgi:hypothetical protein
VADEPLSISPEDFGKYANEDETDNLPRYRRERAVGPPSDSIVTWRPGQHRGVLWTVIIGGWNQPDVEYLVVRQGGEMVLRPLTEVIPDAE